jgi:hypothetical protein
VRQRMKEIHDEKTASSRIPQARQRNHG